MNLLLAVDPSQWVLLGVLVIIIIAAPIMMAAKNKKEVAKAQQIIDSVKKGDKVLTSSGVVGKVVSIDEKDDYKTVTIETGSEKYKGYTTVDIMAIYANLSHPLEENEQVKSKKEVEKKEEVAVVEEKAEEKTEEINKEEVKEENKKEETKAKTSKSKKTTKK